jgi:hypothetical protein
VSRGGGDDYVVAAYVPLERLERTAHHELHAHRGCEMYARIDRAYAFVDQAAVENRPLDELHQLRVQQVLDVAAATGAEIVEDQDAISARGQGIEEVRADEPGPACDQIAHRIPPKRMFFPTDRLARVPLNGGRRARQPLTAYRPT